MRYWRLSLLLVMSRFSSPASAQSSAMEVVTLPAPTIRDSTATATSNPLPDASIVPSILYPVGNPVLNNIDTLVVNYITPWSAVQMTVSCGATVEDSDSLSFRADNREEFGTQELFDMLTFQWFPRKAPMTLVQSNNPSALPDSQYTVTSH